MLTKVSFKYDGREYPSLSPAYDHIKAHPDMVYGNNGLRR